MSQNRDMGHPAFVVGMVINAREVEVRWNPMSQDRDMGHPAFMVGMVIKA
jgi:hypothetical protein